MNSRYNWTEVGEMKAAQGKYLFLLGGTYSPDRGCPEWAPIGMRILFIPAMKAEA